MKRIIIPLLITMSMLCSCSNQTETNVPFSTFERAKLHPISVDRPAVDFFDGPLLGNGGMGVVVNTKPDAVVMYFGHNNVWDIRLSEKNKDKIGTFNQLFNRVKEIPDTLTTFRDDPWFLEYGNMARESSEKPYPRPFPCGSVLLGFDRRNVELIGHSLDISNGLCEVTFLKNNNKHVKLQIITDMSKDQLWMQLIDDQGKLCENIFNRIRILIDPSTPTEFPKARIEEDLKNGRLSFFQTLPYLESEQNEVAKEHPKDKAFRLVASVNNSLVKTTRFDRNLNIKNMEHILEPAKRKTICSSVA